MEHLEIILTITLRFFAFVLKLSIDRSIEVPNIIQAICELPVDMIFLSISFLIAYTIAKPTDPNEGLFFTIAFIVIAVLTVVLWRKSLKLFERKNHWWILLLLLNMTISTFSIFQSMSILLDKGQENAKKETEIKIEKDGN